MKINEWLHQKRINYLYKRACKSLARFDNAIGKDKKNLFLKTLLNSVYGRCYMSALYGEEQHFGEVLKAIYNDTDSVTYKDFNKKQEV